MPLLGSEQRAQNVSASSRVAAGRNAEKVLNRMETAKK
jgi:hypothetical protein